MGIANCQARMLTRWALIYLTCGLVGCDGQATLSADAAPDTRQSDLVIMDGQSRSDAVLSNELGKRPKQDSGQQTDGLPGDGSGADSSPKALSRGLKWVRANRMFISGLTVHMGSPPLQAVNDYHKLFHANAVHLWTFGLPTAMDGWRAKSPANMRWLAWVRKDGASWSNNKIIGGYPPNVLGRIGYQVGDEPLDLSALKSVEAGVNKVRKADPDALVFANLLDSAKDIDAQIKYYCEQMDIDLISHDDYSTSNKAYARMARYRTAGLKHGLPYWRYLTSYHYKTKKPDLHATDLRWHALSGLVYGYTGHSWFIYQSHITSSVGSVLFNGYGSFSAPKTALYFTAAKLNQEMANLGRCITQLTSTDVRYIPALGFLQPTGTKTWSIGAGGDPFISSIAPAPGQLMLDILAGFFKDDHGEIYVMVQNVRHKGGSWPTNSTAPGTIRLSFDFGSSSVNKTKLLSLDKTTMKVTALPLVSLGGSKAYYDAGLAAGDVLLFKYATGATFALQP